jgi:hypothetical protein
MEAGLDAFIKAYAMENNLPEVTVALLAGAMSHKALEKLDEYKQFVLTLNQVAPHLIGYIENLGR